MLVNKTTLTTPANNRPTTDEWEALITAKSPQDRRTTTTKEESHVDHHRLIENLVNLFNLIHNK